MALIRRPLSPPHFEDLARFYSPWTGLVRGTRAQGGVAEEAALHQFLSRRGLPPDGEDIRPVYCGGSGWTRSEALLRSIGESIERHSSLFARPSLQRRTLSEMRSSGLRFFDPSNEGDLFAVEQGLRGDQFQSWDADLALDWVETWDYPAKQPIWVPFACVTLSSRDCGKIWVGTTNGNAVHSSIERATESAILELIERDAMMRTWWLRKSPARHRLEDFQKALSPTAFRAAKTYGDRLSILSFENVFGVSIFAVLIEGENRYEEPALTLGAAAGFDMAETVDHALREALTIYRNGCHSIDHWRNAGSNGPDGIESFTDVWAHYCQDRNKESWRFLLSSPFSPLPEIPAPPADAKVRLESLRERFLACGKRLYLCDLSVSELESQGFFCVRAFSPDLIPINSRHRWKPWGVLLRTEKGVTLSQLNNDPQPFP